MVHCVSHSSLRILCAEPTQPSQALEASLAALDAGAAERGTAPVQGLGKASKRARRRHPPKDELRAAHATGPTRPRSHHATHKASGLYTAAGGGEKRKGEKLAVGVACSTQPCVKQGRRGEQAGKGCPPWRSSTGRCRACQCWTRSRTKSSRPRGRFVSSSSSDSDDERSSVTAVLSTCNVSVVTVAAHNVTRDLRCALLSARCL